MWGHFHLLFVYMFESQIYKENRKAERERFYICCFTHQLFAAMGAGPDRSQDLVAPSGLPNSWAIFFCYFFLTVSKESDLKKSRDTIQHLNGWWYHRRQFYLLCHNDCLKISCIKFSYLFLVSNWGSEVA